MLVCVLSGILEKSNKLFCTNMAARLGGGCTWSKTTCVISGWWFITELHFTKFCRCLYFRKRGTYSVSALLPIMRPLWPEFSVFSLTCLSDALFSNSLDQFHTVLLVCRRFTPQSCLLSPHHHTTAVHPQPLQTDKFPHCEHRCISDLHWLAVP